MEEMQRDDDPSTNDIFQFGLTRTSLAYADLTFLLQAMHHQYPKVATRNKTAIVVASEVE